MIVTTDANAPGRLDPRCRSVLTELAGLQTMPTAALKARWRELFSADPPPFSRSYLQSRLAHRIQELTVGGLRPETVARLEALGEELDGGKLQVRRAREDGRPVAGTRLTREHNGVEHVVTVRVSDFEYRGRPYRSLSAVARCITGTRWNGWAFFGLKSQRGRA